MTPFVRDGRGALEWKERLIRERLESERRGHAVNRNARKIKVEERRLRPARAGGPPHRKIPLRMHEGRLERSRVAGNSGQPTAWA